MAKASYPDSLRRLLAHEGGYSDHAADPGGPTNFGITLAVYRRYVNAHADAAAVRAMRVEQAQAIYRAAYWDALRCDELPAGVDYAVFDYGVNSGVARATRVLRGLLGLAASGAVDDATVMAAQGRDAGAVIGALCEERLACLKRLKTWPAFGRGWSRRVGEVKAAALAMAATSPSPPAAGPPSGPPPQGAVPTIIKTATGGAVIGGIVAAGQASGSWEGWAILIGCIVLALLAAAGLALWRRRRGAGAAASAGASNSDRKDLA